MNNWKAEKGEKVYVSDVSVEEALKGEDEKIFVVDHNGRNYCEHSSGHTTLVSWICIAQIPDLDKKDKQLEHGDSILCNPDDDDWLDIVDEHNGKLTTLIDNSYINKLASRDETAKEKKELLAPVVK